MLRVVILLHLCARAEAQIFSSLPFIFQLSIKEVNP